MDDFGLDAIASACLRLCDCAQKGWVNIPAQFRHPAQPHAVLGGPYQRLTKRARKTPFTPTLKTRWTRARLYESPFTDISQQGLEALFLSARVTEMVRVLDEIRARVA